MYWLYLALVLIGGSGLSLQVAWNSRLRESVGSPAASSLISICVSFITLLPVVVFGLLGTPRLPAPGTVPWWAWCGGIMGAFYLTVSLLALPKVGAALVVAYAVTGQMVCALALDSLGLFGVPRVPLSPYRLLGAALLVAGLLLLNRR